jgi:hypothetical protein
MDGGAKVDAIVVAEVDVGAEIDGALVVPVIALVAGPAPLDPVEQPAARTTSNGTARTTPLHMFCPDRCPMVNTIGRPSRYVPAWTAPVDKRSVLPGDHRVS